MRDRFDALGKDALVALIDDVGVVERGTETGATTQRVDVWFRPDTEHRAELRQRGVLGAMVDDDAGSDLELFHNTPTVPLVRECVRKLWTLHHVRELDAKRANPKAIVPLPRLWVISTGRPDGALKVFAANREASWPSGVYVTDREIGLGVVVLSELEVIRETLALRLLARGAVLAQASRELVALPDDAWERRLIEILVRWRREIPLDPILRTPEEEDFMATTNAAFEQFKTSLRDEGRSEGLAPLVRQFGRKLGRPLDEAERATLRARLVTHGPDRLGDVVLDLGASELDAWLHDPAAR